MMSILEARSAPAPLVLLCLVQLCGCAAGVPAADPRTGEPTMVDEDELARMASARREAALEAASPAAREVISELYLSEDGRLLVKSIRAHGGWDAWLGLSQVRYTRTRSPGAGGGKTAPHGAGGREKAGIRFRIDHQGFQLAGAQEAETAARRASAASPAATAGGRDAPASIELAIECFTFALPFILVDPGLRREYLGVELDSRTGEAFEKLRIFGPDTSKDEWLIVFLDQSTSMVKRLFRRREDGALTLTLLSEWRDCAGLLVPVRREVHRLGGLYDHHGLDKPEVVEALEDLHPN